MATPVSKRIEQAWEACREWITAFDGSPNLALFVKVPAQALAPALAALAGQADNFRITSLPAGKPSEPQFIALEALPAHLALLQEGKLAELSANYAHRAPAFDLDVHLVLYFLQDQTAAIELVWWSDQVFSEETDNLAQFTELARAFIELQNLFQAAAVYLSAEGGADPTEDPDAWEEL